VLKCLREEYKTDIWGWEGIVVVRPDVSYYKTCLGRLFQRNVVLALTRNSKMSDDFILVHSDRYKHKSESKT